MELASAETLADKLIELRCGTHLLANVYECLLNTLGDASRAQADFMRFLSGDLHLLCLKRLSTGTPKNKEAEKPQQAGSSDRPIP
jgi:hypothetical protein